MSRVTDLGDDPDRIGPAAPPIHLCIGAPRSGTTWLFNNLRDRDDIFVPAVKEVRFWYGRRSAKDVELTVRNLRKSPLPPEQSDWLDRWRTSAECSAENYLTLMSAEGRPSIDISPIYSIMPSVEIERVVDAIPPGSQVLYFVRNPLDRFMSQLRLHLYMHGNFRGAVADGTIRTMAGRQAMLDRSDYEAVVQRWSSVLGDRFHVFDYARLQRDPEQFLRDVCQALGLATDGADAMKNAANVYATDATPDKVSHLPKFPTRQRAIVAASIKPTVDLGYTIVPAEVSEAWRRTVADACRPDDAPADDEPDSPFHRLMRLTESLGDNCEFGFWQRKRHYEPSSLFRWALAPASAFDDFLSRKTAGRLYRRRNLVRHSPAMVRDTATGFKFHSKLPQAAGDEEIATSRKPELDAIFADEQEKIQHLRHKFFAQARKNPALYVIKGKKLSLAEVGAVAAGLHSYNRDHVVLWVGAGARKTVDQVADHILSAQIPAFAPYRFADDLDDAAWTNALTGCLDHDVVQHLLRSAIR